MEYAFADDEYVVMKAQSVKIDKGKKFSMPNSSELMLTNRNIVYPVKGITGKVKSYEVYPLSNIRIVEGKPQCRLDTSEFMTVKLELAMKDGMVSFEFDGLDGKQEVRAWINAIYELLLGVEAPEEAIPKGRFESFMDEENLADVVGRVFGAFENAFERKRSEVATEIASKCPSCNASIKGRPGETVTCPYCGTYITL